MFFLSTRDNFFLLRSIKYYYDIKIYLQAYLKSNIFLKSIIEY